MDHIKILRRAFEITRDYRALWVFGIILALTTASGGGGNGGGDEAGAGGEFPGFRPELSPELINTLIVAGIAILVMALVLILAGAIGRYLSETALIRMVDGHEATGDKVGVRQGFRLGWSRLALRLFLLDLLIGLSVGMVLLLSLLVAAAPLLAWLLDNLPARVIGTILSIGMGLTVIFAFVAVSIVLSLVTPFFRRALVLENKGVLDGMRRGLALVLQRPGDIIVMGLILFGVGLVWAVVTIPLLIILFLAAVVIGGLPALLLGFLASLFAGEVIPWIVAGIVGVPIVFLVVGVPTLFLNGLVETYLSTTWTLVYRELLALEAARPLPEPPDSPAMTAPAEA